ncbi:paxillin isoform X2 [Brachionus plicatilis]|uniref:Paxillin isoform X2 n=1 Tax=Brachionus plicatilis TaxID=10195 RepID=A0A3M7QAN3_BRAPC|nr:paxillin isoform X2 [Brachionus plicatilis]
MLTALSKTWHLKCFVCFSCKKLLNDESFLEIENSAYCKDCYVSNMAPKCKRCSKAIIENFISALNGYWHPHCFVCQECAMPFNSSCFFEYADMPYCEFHYHQKRGSLCSTCQAPINGRCITALNKKFHPEHFTCSYCLKQLSKGTFRENNERPFCHQCYKKLFF